MESAHDATFHAADKDREARFEAAEAQRELMFLEMLQTCTERGDWYARHRWKLFKKANRVNVDQCKRLEDFMMQRVAAISRELEKQLALAKGHERDQTSRTDTTVCSLQLYLIFYASY